MENASNMTIKPVPISLMTTMPPMNSGSTKQVALMALQKYELY